MVALVVLFQIGFLGYKMKLQNVGGNVLTPQMPTGVCLQNYDNWSKLLKYYAELGYVNEKTTIFAHSIAPIFITHFLIENKIKVKKLVFICGFNNYLGINEEYDTVNESMYCNNIENIHNYCDNIICFYSKNDPYVKYEVEKKFANKVSDIIEVIEDGGHLNSESGYSEFKEILKYID